MLHLRTWHNTRLRVPPEVSRRELRNREGPLLRENDDLHARYLVQAGVTGFVNSFANIGAANAKIVVDPSAGFSVHTLALSVSKQIARGQDFCVWNGSIGY